MGLLLPGVSAASAGGELAVTIAEKHQRLDEIQGRPTAWEVVAVSSGGQRVLVGYTERRTGRGLLAVLQSKGPLLARVFGVTEAPVTYPKGHKSITFQCDGKYGGEVTVKLGWSERTCIQAGETTPLEDLDPGEEGDDS